MTHNTVVKRVLVSIGALVLVVATLFVLGLALVHAVPYQPFIIRSYVVQPSVVCPGGNVTATITRRFTSQVTKFAITETWVTVPGNKPVQGNSGKLPTQLLTPHDSYKTAKSPLLHTAPNEPGTYRVEISTNSTGARFGIKTGGQATFYSSNTVRVTKQIHGSACQ